MSDSTNQVDTNAWIFQVWAAFVLSLGTTLVGVYFLPTGLWVKTCMLLGVLFTVSSSFTLAKTVRDNHESQKFINQVKEAKAEKIIREFEDVA